MQSSQLPPPSNLAGPKRQGPPPRTVGPKPGAKPGPPKPKAPTPFGGKPMVPITSLIQAPAFTDPEGPSHEGSVPNSADVVEKGELETKLNEKVEDGVNVVKQNSDVPLNFDIVKPHHEDVHTIEKGDAYLNGELENKTDHGKVEDNKPSKVSQGLEIEHEVNKHAHHKKTEEIENIRRAKLEEQDPEESGKPARSQDPEENGIKPPMFKQSSPTKIKEQNVNDFEDNHLELPPQGKNEKNSTSLQTGPFSKAKQTPFGNLRPNDVKEEEDQDDTRDGDQNPSPVVQMGDYYGKQDRMSSQEDPRDSETFEKPSMPVFFKPKTQAVPEPFNAPVVWQTTKEPEEDVSLTLRVKALEIELDKERREKLAFKSEQDRLLDENASLREQLAEAASKQSAPSHRTDTKDQDLHRKDEEIKRLKSELKSTMEGSRLVTEHSNRVISESTKFKEEAEALIVKLEQEKDELYQKFIAYKKQVQEEYAAKVIALQEREKYLAEKVDEYEKDINRHQTDLKQRAHTIQQLASVNSEVESAVAHWPAFQNVLSQIDAHSKLIDEARFQIPSPVKVQKSPIKEEDKKIELSPAKVEIEKPKQSPVKVVEEEKPKQSPVKSEENKPKKSPIKIQDKKIKQSPPKEEAHNVDLHQDHHDTKENGVTVEPQVHYEHDIPIADIVNVQVEEQGLGIEPHKSVNDDDKVSNTPETRVEDNSQGVYEQEKNDEVQNKLDMDAFQSSEPVEPLDNGWGIEEEPLIEIENEKQEPQETYGEHYEQPQPVEEYREEQVNYGYQEAVEEPRVEEYTEQREQPAEYNYEQPTEQYTEAQYTEQYNYEEPVQIHYHTEPVEPVEYNQEYREEQTQPTEYYQEPAEYKVEQIQHHEEVVQPLEVNYEEPQVHVEQAENRDFEEQPPAAQPESDSQPTYSNAFTAVPAYRIPSKKKKKGAKKTAAAFKPAQASYNMPDQPQDMGVEEPSHHQIYKAPVEQPTYSHYEAPVDQPAYSHYETPVDQPSHYNYEAPVDQSSHYNYETPVVHTQDQGYEQSGWGHDNIELDPEVRPSVEERPPEVEAKPPQAVTFGRTPLQAKKAGGKKSKVPKASAPKLNTFSQPWTPPVSTYTEQNNGVYHQESHQIASEEINMENPPAYTEPARTEEAQIPSMQSVDSTNGNEINGHGQPPKQGKGKVVKSKVIKKKQPATGSIFS